MSATLYCLTLIALGAPQPEDAPAAPPASDVSRDEPNQPPPENEAPPGGPALATLTTTTATTAEAATPEFIKGEFAHAGVIRIVPERSFLGVRVGALFQEETIYLAVAPKADLRFLDGDLRLGLEVPINLEFYSLESAAEAGEGGGGFDNAGQVREGDYDEARDFVKFLRYLTYGKKEDNLFVNVGQLYSATLGHGQIMRRYAGNVDINQTRVGVEVDAYGDYGGFEFFLADVTRGDLFGALGFVKPLSLFTTNEMARSFSIGVSWATDQKAPFQLQRGDPVGAAPVGPVQTMGQQSLLPRADTRAANIIGIDAELKVFRNDTIDLKTYADFSMLHGSGSGVAVGVLGRFNFHAGNTLHLLRTRLELRTYESDFVPSYFDTLYEFQQYQFTPDPDEATPNFPTKLAYIRNRTGDRRFGVYAEATYALPGWLVLAAVFETESAGEDQHLMLHAEIPWSWLQIFATYHQRNFDRPFTFGQNDVLYAGGRLKILPILFVNGRVQKSFAWSPSAFDDLGAYDERLNFQVDAEFGWQF